ncbi:hypothetical protein EVAR_74034_1 [Eumeta japonica]|uniref:Uncharacterized protein n=1 Tax=Eumeta variegata TaxID=151549 RepID=A0A4C1T5M7_EUMVA|nr:hypothetical protein EVAR_74034_1 [Eumeta japonica]
MALIKTIKSYSFGRNKLQRTNNARIKYNTNTILSIFSRNPSNNNANSSHLQLLEPWSHIYTETTSTSLPQERLMRRGRRDAPFELHRRPPAVDNAIRESSFNAVPLIESTVTVLTNNIQYN